MNQDGQEGGLAAHPNAATDRRKGQQHTRRQQDEKNGSVEDHGGSTQKVE